MKQWIVSATTKDFTARVDEEVRCFLGPFKDFQTFSVAQYTMGGFESFNCTDGVALPNNFTREVFSLKLG